MSINLPFSSFLKRATIFGDYTREYTYIYLKFSIESARAKSAEEEKTRKKDEIFFEPCVAYALLAVEKRTDKGNANAIVRRQVLRQVVRDLRKVPVGIACSRV